MINIAVTSKYNKDNSGIKNRSMLMENISSKKVLLIQLEINGNNDSFITLKDHKENFSNGKRINKAILDKASKNIKGAMRLNLQKKNQTVIHWFKGICIRHLHKLVKFDIKKNFIL